MLRGDVHRLPAPRGSRGHEQQRARFAVVVQADEFAALSTVVVAPTSLSALPASFRPEVEVEGQQTRVLVEQVRAVDRDRLGERVGHLGVGEQRAVDEALGLVLAV